MSDELAHWCPPCHAGDVKKNQIILLKGYPCKIQDVKTSKTGKHGHAKCNITGTDVFTGKKVNVVEPAHSSMQVAKTEKKDYQLMDLQDDGTISCLTEENDVIEVECDTEADAFVALSKAFEELPEDKEIIVTVQKAPYTLTGKIELKEGLVTHKTQNAA